jgi:hypothetical protein
LFDSGMYRRCLHDGAGKLFGGFMHLFFCEMGNIFLVARLAFKIIRWRGGADSEGAGVFFFHAHVFIDLLGKLPRTQDQQTRCQRIQRSRMANFRDADKVTHFSYNIKRGPLNGFIKQQHFAFEEFVHRRKSNEDGMMARG